MGIYLNPNNANFRETLSRNIYVDKTMMLASLNKIMRSGNKYVCVSRPRRFEKTIAGNMIAAYFSKGCDSRDLFASYKISKDQSFEYALNKYTVIREMTTGKGFADVVYIPVYEGDPAIIIELKRNGSTDSALNQIREKKYFKYLEHYSGKLLFVGINYDEQTKKNILVKYRSLGGIYEECKEII